MKATGTFTPTKWDEKTTTQISPTQKITKASVELSFVGNEISGKAAVEWIMFYRYADEKDQHNSSAEYVGIIRFEGALNGRNGSFAMEDRGTFEKGTLNASQIILEGSGTGKLTGISGSATYRTQGKEIRFEIEYQLA